MENFAFQWEIGFLVKAVSALLQDIKVGQDYFKKEKIGLLNIAVEVR